MAQAAGVGQVGMYDVFVHGPNRLKKVLSIETSTPRAKAFLDALFATEWFDPTQDSVTARELRAIFAQEPMAEVTRPVVEPALDVLQDLWQLSHLTPSYIGRAAGAAVLLAHGMFENSAVSIVVAALFLPFLPLVLAVSFGLWVRDRALAIQGLRALSVSTILSVAAGAVVGLFHKEPMQFHAFEPPLVCLAISAVIGIAAGLASADDAGRRYLIGVAAAVQYAVFPVWVGICLIHGFPDAATIGTRIGSFAVNIATIAGMATLAYAWAGMRPREISRFQRKRNALG